MTKTTRFRNLFRMTGMAAALLLPGAGHAQALDQLINDLLISGCDVLINDLGGLPSGNLNTVICADTTGADGQSSGGGATTPTSLPIAVKERLEKARGEATGAEAQSTEMQFGQGMSLYASGQYESLDRDETTFEDGYDSDIWQLSVGADNRVAADMIAGIALNAAKQGGDFDTGGDFDIDSYGVTVYGLFRPGSEMFLQLAGTYTAQTHDRTRVAEFIQGATVNVRGKVTSDYDADQYGLQLLGGYNYSNENITYGPRVGLDWIQTDYDDYSESGNTGLELSSHDDDVASLQSSLGLWGSMATSSGSGVMTTQASIAWKHEFDQDQRDVEVSFVDDLNSARFEYQTEKPDRDFFEFNLGVTFVFPNDIHTFVNYRTLLDHDFIDHHVATVGLRMGI